MTVLPVRVKNLIIVFNQKTSCNDKQLIARVKYESHPFYRMARCIIYRQLFHQLQFFNDIRCTTQFINTPEHITYVNIDGPVQVFIISDLMAQCLIVAIKRKTDQFSIAIQDR